MVAAVLHEAPGALSIEDVVLDAPMGHEVLVRTKATGLCHSDLHYVQGHSVSPLPVVLGHEGAGVVEAVGPEVRYVAPGDHVVTFAVGFCGCCRFCLAGRPTLCDGWPASIQRDPSQVPRLRLSDGAPVVQHCALSTFAEQMLVHENSLVRISKEMPLDRAALMGCGVATGLGAVLRTAQVRPGALVAVIGCGGIGLNCIQGAIIGGANRVIGIDSNPGKLELAKRFGATDVVDASEGEVLDEIRELAGPAGGVDYSFEAVGKKETYELAFQILGRAGVATVLGVLPPGEKFELVAHDFLTETRIQGARMGSIRFREDIPYFVDLYLQGRLKVDELVSDRIPLEEIEAGYAQIGQGGVARTVVVFD